MTDLDTSYTLAQHPFRPNDVVVWDPAAYQTALLQDGRHPSQWRGPGPFRVVATDWQVGRAYIQLAYLSGKLLRLFEENDNPDMPVSWFIAHWFIKP